MAPHGGAGSYLKGPGPSRRKRAKKRSAAPELPGRQPPPPASAKAAKPNLTTIWVLFPIRWRPARPADSQLIHTLRHSIHIRSVDHTRTMIFGRLRGNRGGPH